MADIFQPLFDSAEQTIEFWREKCRIYANALDAAEVVNTTLQAIVTEVGIARDEAGFLGTGADCIRHQAAEIAKLKSAGEEIGTEKARLMKLANAEIARLTAERDELLAKVAGLDGRIAGMLDAREVKCGPV